jgi:signal transduction histidine kinase
VKSRRGLWTVYGVCATAVVAAMAWVTSDLLALERAQQEAAADARHQESLRLALWRMDSWLSTAVAVETRGWIGWNRSSSSHGMTPGPTPIVKSYVRVGRSDAGEAVGEWSALHDYETLWRRVDRGLDRLGRAPRDVATTKPSPASQTALNFEQMAQRAGNNAAAQGFASGVDPSTARASAGAWLQIFVPMWVGQGDAQALVYLRRDTLGQQWNGFVADWEFVRGSLLGLVDSSLPGATLRSLSDDEVERDRTGLVLASAPIALDAPRPDVAALPLVTPTRTTLGIAWLALACSFVAVGVSLKRTSDLSERRSRFASSVTHELRTPLTTFRLYSEMLADGMVTDAAQRQTYLDTLKSESSRLASLVENVLAYARVEEGRMPLRRERIAVADLLLRVQPVLDRRAKDAGMTLAVAAGDAASAVVDVDPDVVGQVLFNLVDNAAKYAASAPSREIAIGVSKSDGRVSIRVADHGPGIAPDRVRAAFTPFERAGRPAGDTVPGIGLGLALSRALARDLGGDLDYEPAPGGGACFVLTLPA